MFKGMFKKTTKTTKELQPQVCSVPTITELEHVLFFLKMPKLSFSDRIQLFSKGLSYCIMNEIYRFHVSLNQHQQPI